MKQNISFYTFGCRLNQSETASIENSFDKSDYRVVDLSSASDIIVINTCTVTEGGDADTRHLVNKINRLNPKARIALVGCQAQVQKEKLADLSNVKWIVGNQRKMDLRSVFDEYPNPLTAQLVTPTIEREPFTSPIASIDHGHTRANIKIQDGCDFFCSFCEIPYARGRARSRVFDDILLEANTLVEAGYKELILTGINIGTYNNSDKCLLDVIDALEQLEGLQRIRISSIEPTTIPAALIDRMGEGKLCRYLHIPLQSGHDDTLTAMKRKYSLKQFSDFINDAYRKVPQICIGTDVIVGFPGETEAHFKHTVDFLREAPIHYFHVFSYSPRHMAKSRDLDDIPRDIIYARSQELQELSARKRRIFQESLLGTVQDVLFEKGKDGVFPGLTDHYVRVKVQHHADIRNQILPVKFSHIENQAVIGHLNE